ncbi:unnamed protein product [Oppiella nova]|uniref:Uncharacterized protein n=1 Tax=Oppiella nova TaxID=334625 RepID=A0A7R9M498_9ACAR|nr:unnamed protein product [Oppiella nova]CAG2170256.1 unnamed protein product [Oppiella nova]
MNLSDNTLNLWNGFDVSPGGYTIENWYEVSNQLDWIWYLHCYAFASLYFALSSITLISVLRLRTALYLYIDPYGSKNCFKIH